MSIAVKHKGGEMSGLAWRSLDGLQQLWEARTRVEALMAKVEEQLANIDALERQAQELLDENRSLQHQQTGAGLAKGVMKI